ncbi:citrulline utilization hydrolase CtlX [Parapedobacter lycopersici]|uniref:citrulline utilization hydrolase CtlX n=1 Tax=Parapedobacter lycopersici TaxID=1864939 RepID=UPI0033404003
MTILMIRPAHFEYNPQTAVNNAFQQKGPQYRVHVDAVAEFDHFVEVLRQYDIDVLVVQDIEIPHTPDSVFPNNWISFHPDGTVVLYPMFAQNRRSERKETVFNALSQRFAIGQIIDYTHYEENDRFLEGTGSFVLDRDNRVAFAARSPRTDGTVFGEFCKQMSYRPVFFSSFDTSGRPIYHTNVLLCIADHYAVINLASIPEHERAMVREELEGIGKTIIPITPVQMQQFAGNMLQVRNRQGKPYLVLSSRAYRALLPEQVAQLESYNPIIHVSLDTIEENGGGSARCMMAEVFLPVKSVANL